MSRRRYAALVLLALIALGAGLAGWIYGIVWASGIKHGWSGAGCIENGGCAPWQAVVIWFAPVEATLALALAGGMAWKLRGIWREYQRLPSGREVAARRRINERWEREQKIAQLEWELGIGEDEPGGWE